MTRSVKVEVRCTPTEKARWIERAGGARHLSTWIRDLPNLAGESAAVSSRDDQRPSDPTRAVQAATPLERPVAPPETAGLPARVVNPLECPRATFHRDGVFCKACGL